jgi:hypothetical protein
LDRGGLAGMNELESNSLLDFSKLDTSEKYSVLVADMHLHHLPTWRLHWCEDFIASLLKLSNELGDSNLILLGDTFELRDRVDARVANLFIKLVLQWEGDVLWLVGQHDSYIPGHATFAALDGVDGITIVDSEVYQEDGVYYIPFFRDQAHYLAELAKIPDNSFLFTHLPVAEALFGKGDAAKALIPVKEFSRFKKVWAGDIHVAGQFKNLEYVGAPGQRDFRDTGVEGRIVLLDERFNSTSIPVKHPIHIKLTSTAEAHEFDTYMNRNPDAYKYIVRITDTEISQEKLLRLKEHHGVLNVEVEVSTISMESIKVQDFDKSNEQILREYLNNNSTFKFKRGALKIGMDILNEAEQNNALTHS